MAEQYTTKDSGVREEYKTGARRDTQSGKGRFDLLPYYPLLRLARLYERGAEKYDAHNWKQGIPLSRFLSSATRHLLQFSGGMRDEDHLAAVAFNVFGIIWTEAMIRAGALPAELNDLHRDAMHEEMSSAVFPS